jgi:hypothetical protein
MVHLMITDAVRDLYIARWGQPSRKATFEVDGLEVDIFKWSAEINSEGVNLYATIGASARPMAERNPDHRVEFFTGLLPARDEIASPLAALALYPWRNGVVLDHGHTVPADGPLWPGTEMKRFLLLRPLSDVALPFDLPGEMHIEFLQAIPILESEFAYMSGHSAEALLRRWQESHVQFWNSNRRPEPAFD